MRPDYFIQSQLSHRFFQFLPNQIWPNIFYFLFSVPQFNSKFNWALATALSVWITFNYDLFLGYHRPYMDWLKCWSKKQLDEIGLRALGGWSHKHLYCIFNGVNVPLSLVGISLLPIYACFRSFSTRTLLLLASPPCSRPRTTWWSITCTRSPSRTASSWWARRTDTGRSVSRPYSTDLFRPRHTSMTSDHRHLREGDCSLALPACLCWL